MSTFTARIDLDGDNPTAVTIGDHTAAVPEEPADAPGARIRATIECMGYRITSPFRQHAGEDFARVEVVQA